MRIRVHLITKKPDKIYKREISNGTKKTRDSKKKVSAQLTYPRKNLLALQHPIRFPNFRIRRIVAIEFNHRESEGCSHKGQGKLSPYFLLVYISKIV